MFYFLYQNLNDPSDTQVLAEDRGGDVEFFTKDAI